MRFVVLILGALAALSPVAGRAGEAADVTAAEAQLRAAETAFARAMADRDLTAFTSFIADDAVFFGGGGALRGREAIVAGWARFFEDEAAPFSWAPQDVFVLATDGLGLSSGPVHGADGAPAGFFTSTWRRDPDGAWKIVLDRGCPPCE